MTNSNGADPKADPAVQLAKASVPPTCIVCGREPSNLSSLGRCWDCIKRASDAWTARVEAARTAETPSGWEAFWAAFPKPKGVMSFPEYLFLERDARRQFEVQRRRRPSGSPRNFDARHRLGGIVARLLDAQVGERNSVLHWCACRCGEMVASGELDEQTAVDVLQDAATRVGLTPSEIGDAGRGTVGSGMRAGWSS